LKKNRSPSMRKFALMTACEDPGLSGLLAVNQHAKKMGEHPYPASTWNCLVKNEVPRVKKFGNEFFNSHTNTPCTFSRLKDQWPL